MLKRQRMTVFHIDLRRLTIITAKSVIIIDIDKLRVKKYNESGENMRKYDYILFDLDGTLSESAEGVRLSIEHALSALSLPCPDLSDYTLYIGPPLEDTFRGLCAVPEKLIQPAMVIYRDYYDDIGIRNNGLYSGVIELLDRLREGGCRLAICTSKNEPVAERVAESLGLIGHIDAICGSTLDGSRRAKADIIPYALSTLGCTDKSRAVMVGDTHFDASGAAATELDFIGVTYGYGSRDSMEAVGGTDFADTPMEVYDHIIIH